MEYISVVLVVLMILTQSSQNTRKGKSPVTIEVPEYVIEGQTVHMYCSFNYKSFYSLKWFLNETEIYRYIPNTDRELQRLSFNPETASVDLQSSKMIEDGRHMLVLLRIQHQQSGMYKCQVTEDSPPFRFHEIVDPMTVIILPNHYPSISGLRGGWYELGSTLKLNCSSSASYPPAKLTWTLNHQTVKKSYVTEYLPQVLPSGLAVSTLGLNLEIQKDTSRDGRIHLTCTASLPPVQGDKMEMSRSLVVPVYPPLYSGLSAANTLICDIVLVIFSFYFSIL